jgi:hypothetical protein
MGRGARDPGGSGGIVCSRLRSGIGGVITAWVWRCDAYGRPVPVLPVGDWMLTREERAVHLRR